MSMFIVVFSLLSLALHASCCVLFNNAPLSMFPFCRMTDVRQKKSKDVETAVVLLLCRCFHLGGTSGQVKTRRGIIVMGLVCFRPSPIQPNNGEGINKLDGLNQTIENVAHEFRKTH